MKKLLVVLFLAVAFCSCTTTSPMLYRWGGYEYLYHQYYKTQTPESYAQLYIAYNALVTNPGGARSTVPPGICAEFGYMLLEPETSAILIDYYNNPNHFPIKQRKEMEGTDWNQVFAPELLREKGLKMLRKEIELYPESATFLAPIINKFSQQQP